MKIQGLPGCVTALPPYIIFSATFYRHRVGALQHQPLTKKYGSHGYPCSSRLACATWDFCSKQTNWGCCSTVECLPSLHKVLGSIPSMHQVARKPHFQFKASLGYVSHYLKEQTKNQSWKKIIKVGARELAQWFRGPRLDSRCPQDGSQPFPSPIPGDLMPSSDVPGHVCGTHRRTLRQDTHTHKIN